MIDTYKRKINAPGYESKVPEDVRLVNTEKLAGYEAEMDTTVKALTTFQNMTLY